MSYYQLCCQHKGKVVQIYEKSGKVHHGRIVEVDREYVWLDTRGGGPRGFTYGGYPGYGAGFGGYGAPGGYGAYGAGYGGYAAPGYGAGFGRHPYFAPVALAAVGGLALGAAFFW
ncbi:hypothetical protein BKP35_11745 [Anaerobacillus arseniciselenatis]|uniref:Uncharacterized protein n=1 Tax=Anaerobacillus arseniciselenatis TaxID=85682 RepID=A0A1S2LGV7_9BACI|nr:hypothetical protein [Anaerobacillus arseniciselenatis]OIJ11606.1 hypothetical protein BKP35_11745 [Anaerobacillus arseniciselenatis]